jgi:diguanylate cyclase (GGDEF)-like protein/PAS domain S-box-containing protein
MDEPERVALAESTWTSFGIQLQHIVRLSKLATFAGAAGITLSSSLGDGLAHPDWLTALDLGLPESLLPQTHPTPGDLEEVHDTHADSRFSALSMGGVPVRFYCGAALPSETGTLLAHLYVVDSKPRRLTVEQRDLLRELAALAAGIVRQLVRLSRERRHPAYIIEETGAGTWEWNVQTGETRFNRQWAQIIGHKLEDLGPASMQLRRDRAHPQDLARSDEILNRHLSGLRPSYECEVRLRHREGHWVWVLSRGRVQTWTANREPEWMFGLDIDISASKRQEATFHKTQTFLNRIGEVAGVGGWELDLGSDTVLWTDETCRIHGVARGFRPTLEQAIEFYSPAARPVIQAAVERGLREGTSWDLELPLRRTTGESIWVRAVGSAEFEDGRAIRLIGAFQDVTVARQLRSDLSQQHELLSVTLRSIGDAVITTDATGHVLWLNPVAETMTGWSKEDAEGHCLADVFRRVDAETRESTEDPVATALCGGAIAPASGPQILISRNGPEYGIEGSAAAIRNDAGVALGVVMVFRDVTEQRRLSGEMSYRATHDTLTGLMNRPEFESRLGRLLQTRRKYSEHALLFVDIDHFKLVNDTCGHAVGDQLLRTIAKVLGNAVRGRDSLARLGGDEFAILLEDCPMAAAITVGKRICEDMDALRFVHEARSFRLGASVGLVCIDEHWETIESLMQAADSSCYAAKESGRNRLQVWVDSDTCIRRRGGEMQWAMHLEQALDEDRFVLYAQRIQPLQRAATGMSAEVLVRLVGKDGEMVTPGAFLPAAERFHLAARIDRWVLRRALTWLRAEPLRAGLQVDYLKIDGSFITALPDEPLSEAAVRCFVEVARVLGIETVAEFVDQASILERVRAMGVDHAQGYLLHRPCPIDELLNAI